MSCGTCRDATDLNRTGIARESLRMLTLQAPEQALACISQCLQAFTWPQIQITKFCKDLSRDVEMPESILIS
jgi:hypothetical protein